MLYCVEFILFVTLRPITDYLYAILSVQTISLKSICLPGRSSSGRIVHSKQTKLKFLTSFNYDCNPTFHLQVHSRRRRRNVLRCTISPSKEFLEPPPGGNSHIKRTGLLVDFVRLNTLRPLLNPLNGTTSTLVHAIWSYPPLPRGILSRISMS